MSERSGELRNQCANYALPSLPTYPSLPEEQNYSPSTPSERSSTREARSEVDGWLDEPLRDRLYEFDTPEGPRHGWYRPFIWVEAFHSNRSWPVDDVPRWRLLVPQPLNSAPVQGPVEGRGVAEIRADLARVGDQSLGGLAAWPGVAGRLVADVPSLLAEVEAAHRFERSAAAEREALLAEVAMCRRIRDEMQDVAGAAVAAKASAYVDIAALRGAIEQALADWDNRGTGGASNIFGELSAALAAAADAPQTSEPCGVEWVGCYAADLHYSCGEPKGHVGNHRAGPSPAVLPEKEQRDV